MGVHTKEVLVGTQTFSDEPDRAHFLRGLYMTVRRNQGPAIAKRLREVRLALGLSQRELGVQAGMDPSVASPRINQYERGKHLPDPLTLERLGRVLNCPLPFFYAADDAMATVILGVHLASGAQREQLLRLATKIVNP